MLEGNFGLGTNIRSFIIVQADKFQVWSWWPATCSEDSDAPAQFCIVRPRVFSKSTAVLEFLRIKIVRCTSPFVDAFLIIKLHC